MVQLIELYYIISGCIYSYPQSTRTLASTNRMKPKIEQIASLLCIFMGSCGGAYYFLW
ncbi:hypothetical protein BDV36DRAFT_261930 [Aspergillus pseudocaelatus]|uniref:Uncharacterized protein n=1 Tax=Aspergillus pseudocaelatus TaxID=1825620 RepID=A0ABQ6WGV7_9EURO|nr:hypothetical protein BDV36DRAFT_261930 [Aspergillus pseudocaelatus]